MANALFVTEISAECFKIASQSISDFRISVSKP